MAKVRTRLRNGGFIWLRFDRTCGVRRTYYRSRFQVFHFSNSILAIGDTPCRQLLCHATRYFRSPPSYILRDVQRNSIATLRQEGCLARIFQRLSAGSGEPYVFSVQRSLDRSADFQSAVSPNCIRQGVGSVPGDVVSQRLAECNSALRWGALNCYGDPAYRDRPRGVVGRVPSRGRVAPIQSVSRVSTNLHRRRTRCGGRIRRGGRAARSA